MRSIWPVFALVMVATACSNGATDPVEVTGTTVCTQIASDGLKFTYNCEDQTSDPRVSGAWFATVIYKHLPPTPMSGTLELVNEGGTWIGDWTGEITSTGNHIVDAVLVGTGEYEGLEYEMHWEGVEYPWTITGTIRDSA